MQIYKQRFLTLAAALAVAAAGCQGEKGPAGSNGQPGIDGANGANGANGAAGANGATGATGATGTQGAGGAQGAAGQMGFNANSSGLVVAITNVSLSATNVPTVRFTLKDDQGYPVDLAGAYSVNLPIAAPRFGLWMQQTRANGQIAEPLVLTGGGAGTINAPAVGTATGPNTLVENGTRAGDYTFTFPSTVALTDPTQSHTIWIQIARQVNTGNALDPSMFKAVNYNYNWVPTGSAAVIDRQVVNPAKCWACHDGFKPQGASVNQTAISAGFHGSGRIDGRFCVNCHNPAHVTFPQTSPSKLTNSDLSSSTVGTVTTYTGTPAADAAIFVHRIHNGKNLRPANVFDATGADLTFPQDMRNCDACHGGATHGGQARQRADRAVCGSCHDNVDFAGTIASTECVPGNNTLDATGGRAVCLHPGGAVTDDTRCAGCHITGQNPGDRHMAVAAPDSGNIFLAQTSDVATAGYQGGTLTACDATATNPCSATACTTASPCYDPSAFAVVTKAQTSGSLYIGGRSCGTGFNPSVLSAPGGVCTCTLASPCIGAGNNNTNAANVAAAGMKPSVAIPVSWDVKSVSRNASKQPVITFCMKQNGLCSSISASAIGTGGVAASGQLWSDFVGAPSVYFVWATPQDGIAKPADFNASASAYVKTLANKASTTGANLFTGPDANGYYTATLTGSTVPDSAVMLTGGVGYTYALTSTQPLTQVNDANGVALTAPYLYTAATKQGGLVVPAPNKSLVATGYTARRQIVDTNKCNNCHGQLGVNPTFHAGQRNDGPTCSFCHNPNKTSSGWAANAKDFIHSIHAGNFRSVAFNWHAASPTENYGEVTFPGPLNYCDACHLTPKDANGVPTGKHTYDFSNTPTVVDFLLPSTTATGKFNGDNTFANYAFSPYITTVTDANAVTTDASRGYGYGYATSPVKDDTSTVVTGKSACSTSTPCEADPTTLVTSPVMAACVACHDTKIDKAHMTNVGGGAFYQPRSVAAGMAEQCLMCHGPGTIAPIADVHK
jgi:OmcA/MtrC family decaheme c-type cytochrome